MSQEIKVKYKGKVWTPVNLSRYSKISPDLCQQLLRKVMGGEYEMRDIMKRIKTAYSAIYIDQDGFRYTPKILEVIIGLTPQTAWKRIHLARKGEITKQQMLRPKYRHIEAFEPVEVAKSLTPQELRILELEKKYFPDDRIY